MNLVPLFNRIILERHKAEKIGSIFVPKDMQKRHATFRCRVLAVGPEVSAEIDVGDEVIIGIHTGTWINADGRSVANPDTAEYYICEDGDVLARVVEAENADGRGDSSGRGDDAGRDFTAAVRAAGRSLT